MPYNPFDKPIGTPLEVDDLKNLINNKVAEGYHVEYKRIFPAKEKIGKSISALANTYGGWYIVGVETDQNNIANSICGFSLTACTDPISTVREVAKTHIMPVPIFYPQIVSLGQDKVVLVVFVPGDQDTPFISKDGRIYRRVADSSDPVYEKDRYSVDKLYEQGRQNAQRFERFCQDNRTFSRSESGGWVNIFFSPYPHGLINKYGILLRENFEKILRRSQTPLDISFNEGQTTIGQGHIAFNSCQLTHRSVILRSISPTQIAFNSLSIELFVDGSARIFIPLPYRSPRGSRSEELKSPVAKEALRKITVDESSDYLRFFDLGQLWATSFLLLNFYLDWLGDDLLLITDMKTAITFRGMWRSVPFIDMDEWGLHVEKFGLPIMFADNIDIPEDLGRGLILDLRKGKGTSPLWTELTFYIGSPAGFPQELCTAAILNALLNVERMP